MMMQSNRFTTYTRFMVINLLWFSFSVLFIKLSSGVWSNFEVLAMISVFDRQWKEIEGIIFIFEKIRYYFIEVQMAFIFKASRSSSGDSQMTVRL